LRAAESPRAAVCTKVLIRRRNDAGVPGGQEPSAAAPDPDVRESSLQGLSGLRRPGGRHDRFASHDDGGFFVDQNRFDLARERRVIDRADAE